MSTFCGSASPPPQAGRTTGASHRPVTAKVGPATGVVPRVPDFELDLSHHITGGAQLGNHQAGSRLPAAGEQQVRGGWVERVVERGRDGAKVLVLDRQHNVVERQATGTHVHPHRRVPADENLFRIQRQQHGIDQADRQPRLEHDLARRLQHG